LSNKLLLLMLICSLVLSTGCWNRVEIEDRSFVKGVAVDKAKVEEKIQITAQLAKIQAIRVGIQGGGGGGEKAFWTISSTGWTVFDAVRNFVNQASRKLFWSFNEVIIFGEELAKEGVGPAVDFFLRGHEARRRAWILVAKGSPGTDILVLKYPLEPVSAVAISDLIEASGAVSTSIKVDLNKFAQGLASQSGATLAGRIELMAGEKEDEPQGLRLTGAAVFKKDKLIGWLDRKETRGVLWAKGEVKSGIIVAQAPDDEAKTMGLEIIRANGKIVPQLTGGQLVIVIEVNLESHLGDQLSGKNLTETALLDRLAKAQTTVVENEIKAALAKAQQELKADFFGFGDAVYRSFPRLWEEELKHRWDDIFPDLKVELKVSSQIRRPGMITEPFWAGD
jgi:spore germination protein KC